MAANRRHFLQTLGLGVAGLATSAASPGWLTAGAAEDRRPNILVLLTDDQQHNAIAALGNRQVRTPHIDRLVHEGLAFTHCHIMGSTSAAVCMPSRAMALTGRHLFALTASGARIEEEHTILPEALRRAGYATFGTGKWHNGKPSFARGFDHGGDIFFGGMADHLRTPVFDFDPQGEYPNGQRRFGEAFSTELFTDAFLTFLNRRPADRPFFAWVSFTSPHDPRMAPKEFADLYPPDQIELPENFLPVHSFDNGEMRIRDELLAPFPRTPAIAREHIAAYYAMITHDDHHIGRILRALDDSGLADNTIVVFASDNGLAVGQHGLLGKQNMYDHSVRVPLILRGPGIPEGRKSDALCYLHDLYPSLCDLAGVETPGSVQSRSLAPVIHGEATAIRDSLFLAYRDKQRAVRHEGWKLIIHRVSGTETVQLFHVESDLWEQRDRSGEPEQAGRLAALRALLEQWRDDVGDPHWRDVPSET